MSELTVGTLSGLAANSYVIDVASGSQLTQPGMVLQVVSTTKTDTFTASLAGGAETDITGLAASITPSSTANKILVLVNVTVGSTTGGASELVTIFRGASQIGVGDAAGSRQTITTGAEAEDGRALQSAAMNFLDSPSTTSSTTYQIKVSHRNSVTDTVTVNRGGTDTDNSSHARGVSSITLMEIAG